MEWGQMSPCKALTVKCADKVDCKKSLLSVNIFNALSIPAG